MMIEEPITKHKEKLMKNTKNAPEAATETEVEATDEVTFSAKEVAAACGTDPKNFRRWLRSITEARANKGGRWIFTAEVMTELIERYAADHAPAEVADEA